MQLLDRLSVYRGPYSKLAVHKFRHGLISQQLFPRMFPHQSILVSVTANADQSSSSGFFGVTAAAVVDDEWRLQIQSCRQPVVGSESQFCTSSAQCLHLLCGDVSSFCIFAALAEVYIVSL